ncbi:DUF5003 domain-containing protein [Phocaeicola plebeius]|uniref:DUF5003 domain-containing protein n=1 Tax=Phocaeicola plebeius TaxID=310297 RepID=A0A414X1V3_9BACT|nr:DUF5003 domain-containing protein [Phocaeicola plebeius]RHH46408.1 DUF5003 domain-containing protein [Phocaeicola plebeius]
MKKNKFTLGWFFISLLMAFAVTACDDDDNDVVNVTFPEKQTIGGAVNETKSLTFDAVADWTLTSSTTWCYFITEETPAAKAAEGVKEYAISGKAGKQTVTIGISEEGQEYDQATVASIIIRMNGQEAVLAEVTRNAAGRTFKLYKKGEGDAWIEVSAEEGIEAGYDNFIQYKAEANFRFAATNRPEWLSIEGGSIVGTTNQAVLFGIKVIENRPDFSKYAQKGNLNFQDEEGKSVFTYAVDYKGMNPEAMSYEGPKQWNWEVSLDGKSFIQTNQGISGGSESSSYNKFVEFTITALNDQFYPIYVEEYTDFQGNPGYEYFLADESAWMKLEVKDAKTGKARVTVSPLDPEQSDIEERTGYVFAFPKALYDKIAEDPENKDYGLFVSTDNGEGMPAQKELRYEYTESNLLMNLVQKELKSAESGSEEGKKDIELISQYWENYGQTVECTELTGEEAEFYKSEWQAAKVFTVKASKCQSIRVNVPFEVVSFGAELNKEDVTDTYCSLPEDGVTTAIDVWGCQDIKSELVIVIRDAMYQKVTVLLVRP